MMTNFNEAPQDGRAREQVTAGEKNNRVEATGEAGVSNGRADGPGDNPNLLRPVSAGQGYPTSWHNDLVDENGEHIPPPQWAGWTGGPIDEDAPQWDSSEYRQETEMDFSLLTPIGYGVWYVAEYKRQQEAKRLEEQERRAKEKREREEKERERERELELAPEPVVEAEPEPEQVPVPVLVGAGEAIVGDVVGEEVVEGEVVEMHPDVVTQVEAEGDEGEEDEYGDGDGEVPWEDLDLVDKLNPEAGTPEYEFHMANLQQAIEDPLPEIEWDYDVHLEEGHRIGARLRHNPTLCQVVLDVIRETRSRSRTR